MTAVHIKIYRVYENTWMEWFCPLHFSPGIKLLCVLRSRNAYSSSVSGLSAVPPVTVSHHHYQELRWILGKSHTFKLENFRHLGGS